jgi:uncharacterized OsmC-like protein
MPSTSTVLNDVDIESVAALAGAITVDPAKSQTNWSAVVDWKGGFRSQAAIRNFAPTVSDEPIGLGGTDTAANPVEQLLGALGNCLAVGYAANLTAAGVTIESLRIDVEGDLDLHTFLGLRQGNAGFGGIRATVSIASDAGPEQIEEIHTRVVATSPVGHTLSLPVPVSIELA